MTNRYDRADTGEVDATCSTDSELARLYPNRPASSQHFGIEGEDAPTEPRRRRLSVLDWLLLAAAIGTVAGLGWMLAKGMAIR